MDTPWGIADEVRIIAKGITLVSTPSHGGIRLSPERLSQIPLELRGLNTYGRGPWFEEDCEILIPMFVWPEEFQAFGWDVNADKTALGIQQWYPDAYRRYVETHREVTR